MFAKIATFEFRYQLKNPVFWVTSAIFFLLTFGATTVEQIRIGATTNVHKNAPYAIMQTSGIMAVFAIFMLVAFVANVVVRDDDTGFGPIIRTTRMRKFDYLIGRFTGAFAASLLSYSSALLGIAVGALMPWVDPETLGAFVPLHFLYAFFVVVLPTLLFTGATFFALATATRSMMATYVGVVVFLIGYFTALILLSKPEYEHMAALVDPFGIAAIDSATKYWTASERNTLVPAISGVILYNRLIWGGAAIAMLALAFGIFRYERVGAPPQQKPASTRDTAPPPAPTQPLTRPAFTAGSAWAQLMARTRIDMVGVFRSPAFFCLLALGLLNSMGALWVSDDFYGNSIYPVTRAMIVDLRGSFLIFPIIIAVYYAGELVWRDRDRRIHEIIDATPVPDWMFVLPKTVALFLVLIATLLASVLAAMLVQTLKGYHHYELGHYIAWYVVPMSITMLILAMFAIFVQTVSPVKYVGWGIMGLYIISTAVLDNLGFEHNLYHIDGAPGVPLSDMNGQGQFWIARAWFQAYWFVFALILGVLSHYLWRRGTEQRLRPRMKRLVAHIPGPGGAVLGTLLVVFVALGSWIYHNTNELNEYRTARGDERYLADYEHTLLGFENLPQPRITDMVLNVDLDPHHLRAHTTGSYVLENRTGKPLDHVHVRWDRNLHMNAVHLDGGHVETDYGRFNYLIYALDKPMQPGEHRTLTFDSVLEQVGFRNSNASKRVVDNGTFLDNTDITPALGMSEEGLLADRVKRRKYGLVAELRLPKLEDRSAQANNMLRNDADWVNSDITVSTVADQIPVAPGYTVSDTITNGRHTARFKSDAPILPFFSIQSADYKIARDRAANGTNLAVYYQAGHEYNVRRMLNAMKAALDIYPKEFSPFQFQQARILEFPAYESFAQSFANTIPYSEAIGFIVNVEKPDSVDMITYVTAHELGHQWWAHQVVSAKMQGDTMLIESFAQYSALLVMEKLDGPEQLRKFLKYELDAYLRARGSEKLEELPLDRVENQPYIHYRKGALVMYYLKDQLGEEVVNAAMRHLIADYAFKPAPYPTTREFLAYLRQEAGPAHDELITDLFDRITLYDVIVHCAHSHARPDGKFDVTLDVEAHKHYADGQGRETEAPLAENFDVGLFSKEPGKPGFTKTDVVSFGTQPIHSGHQTITLVADSKPAFAGVDPYNKRITRNSDTVIAKVE